MAAERLENWQDSVEPGLEMMFRDTLEERNTRGMKEALFPIVQGSKTKNYVKTSGAGGMPPLEVFTGQIAELDQKQLYDKQTFYTEYAGMIKITRSLWDDSEWDVMTDKAAELAIAGVDAQEITAHEPFNNAFTDKPVTFGITGDGTEWCASDHPTTYNTTTQSNEATTAFSAVAVEAGRISMVELLAANGEPAMVAPSALVVGNTNEEAAMELIKSTLKVDGALNNINVHQGRWKVIVLPHRLEDTNNWFILDEDRHRRRNKFHVRVSVEFNRDTEFTTLIKRWSAYGRWLTHRSDWRSIRGYLVA